MILVLSNADSEILALRSVVDGLPESLAGVRGNNPCAAGAGLPTDLDGIKVVVVRLLGGVGAWKEGFADLCRRCADGGIEVVAMGGEAHLDAEMTAASTVPPQVVAEAFAYLAHGGARNVENLCLFLADRVLGLGLGHLPPAEVPSFGVLGEPRLDPSRPTVGVVFYRAQYIAGNVMAVRQLCDELVEAGVNAYPVFCYSLRGSDGAGAIELLASAGVDAVVTTVWAAGSATTGGDAWDATALASLGVPIVQGVTATTTSVEWEGSAIGLPPMDVAMSVAIPEFDGRIVSVPFSFKEVVDDGESFGAPIVAYRPQLDRVRRVAGTAARQAGLSRVGGRDRRIAVVLSAYPTKRSRIGNAVGLDTPASVLALAERLRRDGMRIGTMPAGGDALMAELSDGLIYDETAAAARGAPAQCLGRLSRGAYCEWFAGIDKGARDRVVEAWGEPPGDVSVDPDTGDLLFAGIDFTDESAPGSGAFAVAVQPPRGYGENPIAVYHSPDLPPTHHYLAFYRWLDNVFGAHAIVHMGKHGTLEWLPGKGIGVSSSCFPDIALADVPLVYPFVVNDPGEGAQAKRRAHAVVVDHMVPPMTRAGTYDTLAVIESILDEHARVAALDPAKLPAVRRQLWDAVLGADMHRDLAWSDVAGFDDPSFDDRIVELDGYLCELKDAQIRGGLHVLGEVPSADALVESVVALTRVPQGPVPSLRGAVAAQAGIDPDAAGRASIDELDAAHRGRVEELRRRDWTPRPGDAISEWICTNLVPALRQMPRELDAVSTALRGGYVESGPSGAPTRGMAHVLPTGRNFYTVDPRAIPSRLSYEVGCGLAENLVEKFRTEEGRCPEEIGLVVWGTATMRTAGDDIAQALALLGTRPRWNAETGRVDGVEIVSLEELGRPRVAVTLRISGFFRDAFRHLIELFEDAVDAVSRLDETAADNPLAAERRRCAVAGHAGADPRVFGPGPGAYGSGILALIESGEWEGDSDLASVYLEWGGYSYTRSAMGARAPDAVRRRLSAIDIAVKNQDNREHDIFDSDDYMQDHGGMIAAVRALTGRQPRAFFGDSSDPARPRVRDLAQEGARVMRTRVLNPKWIDAMRRHGYKGAFEMAATVDYVFGYDATAGIIEDWMYESVTATYVADPAVREFFRRSNPHALSSIAERLWEADRRGMWNASPEAKEALRAALLEAEGWEETR